MRPTSALVVCGEETDAALHPSLIALSKEEEIGGDAWVLAKPYDLVAGVVVNSCVERLEVVTARTFVGTVWPTHRGPPLE
jgi:hypothetical protein